MKIFSLNGQVAFVTGAGSGIGQRIAIGLAEAGADVAGFDLPGSKGIARTIEAISSLERKAVALEGNVTQAADLARAVGAGRTGARPARRRRQRRRHRQRRSSAEDMPLDQWQRMLDINLTGIFLSCQAESRVMLPRKRGAIVNIASMSGSIVNRGLLQAHYNTSKAGVVHLTKSLAMEWVDRGIRVNAISPGYTATPMNLRPEVAEQVKRFEAETPMARMARVDEMVGPAVFLASPAASFVTGVDLLVDGGFECW